MTISTTHAEILMALLILARSTSYVMTKFGLMELNVFNLLGFRFLLAFFIMLPFFFRRLIRISSGTLFKGMILGAAASLVMSFEVSGLKTADASTAAFLENTAVVFVPAFEALIHRRLPEGHIVISVIIALSGIALLTLKGGSLILSEGEMLCLTAAMLYSCAIILTERLSHSDDPLILGVLQVGFMGLFTMIISIFNETVTIPVRPSTLYALLALSVICTCFGFTLQPLAQSKLTSERAGLFCAIGPAGGAICGWLFLGEHISVTGIAGMILILCAVILPYIRRIRLRS